MRLEEMPLDIGYASERVSVIDTQGSRETIGGQNGKTQLIITTPSIDDTFKEELAQIGSMIPEDELHEVTAALIVANDTHQDPEIEKFAFYIDDEEEFSDLYGVRLTGEPFDGEMTKAVILISKDGAIFYDEFVTDLGQGFNTDTLLRKIVAAQTCYTGKGCH